MMADAPGLNHECPVCHEDYTEPKILPCTHLVCRNCIISWLGKGGNQGGCPLCRAPILPPAQQGQGDISTLVDAFLTDLATSAVVESQKVLSSRHVCNCGDDVEATLFCLQCSINLCKSCAKAHAKIPLLQDHVTEELSSLTAERLASSRQSTCSSHAGRPAELYCTDHKELICLLCSTSTHRKCSDVEGIGEMAKRKREELRKQVEKMKGMEDALVAQINHLDAETAHSKTEFAAMHAKVKTTFGELKRVLKRRQQTITADIQQREDKVLEEKKLSKSRLEEHRAALAAHKNMAERLVVSAPDCSLLTMFIQLKEKLDAVETKTPSCTSEMQTSAVGNISFDSSTMDQLKKLLDTFGQITEPPQSISQVFKSEACGIVKKGPSGEQFAAVIKVGDRVRRGRDWKWGDQDGTPPGLGTVTKVSSRFKTSYIEVRWDYGHQNNYRMGVDGCYDLRQA